MVVGFFRAGLVAAVVGLVCLVPVGAAPVRVILDTDIGPDCDDAGAVAVLHALAERGEAELVAMMVCTSSRWGVPCLDALNTYFGRPDIPLGTLKDAGFLDQPSYAEEIARRYPHDLKSGVDAPDATDLYRRVLAAEADGAVVLTAVGPLRNLYKLLGSGPDEHSPLAGRELVARKVARLVCMGGVYPGVKEGRDPEWNFAQDAAATRAVLDQWPTPAIFSGGELGGGIMAGRALAMRAPEHHPVSLAYGLYTGYGRDRETWDLIAVLAAVRTEMPSLRLSEPGNNVAGERGANSFVVAADGQDRYLMLDGPKRPLEDLLEELMLAAKGASTVVEHEVSLFAKDGYGSVAASEGSSPAGHAFDRRSDPIWHGREGGAWLQYSLPDGRTRAATSYTMLRKGGPETWTFSGSRDGCEWTVLDRQTEQQASADGAPRRFPIAQPEPFGHYRLDFAAGSKPEVQELSIFERIERKAGQNVESLTLDRTAVTLAAGTRSTVNARLLPADALDQSLVWSSSAPHVAMVQPLGSSAGTIAALAPGAATLMATAAGGRIAARCAITVTPSEVPAPWQWGEVNAPEIPGSVVWADGVFTLTGSGESVKQWWTRIHDQFSLLHQPIAGEVRLSARLAAQSSAAPEAQAGLTLRATLDRDRRYATLSLRADGEVLLLTQDGKDPENPRETRLGKRALPVSLRLERRAGEVTVWLSADGRDWGAAPSACLPDPLAGAAAQAGLFATASRRPLSNTATFSEVALEAKP